MIYNALENKVEKAKEADFATGSKTIMTLIVIIYVLI